MTDVDDFVKKNASFMKRIARIIRKVDGIEVSTEDITAAIRIVRRQAAILDPLEKLRNVLKTSGIEGAREARYCANPYVYAEKADLLFYKNGIKIMHGRNADQAWLYCLTTSGAYDQIHKTNDEIVDEQMALLRRYYPAAQNAKVVQAQVVKMPRATFSQTVGTDALRPPQRTSVPSLVIVPAICRPLLSGTSNVPWFVRSPRLGELWALRITPVPEVVNRPPTRRLSVVSTATASILSNSPSP